MDRRWAVIFACRYAPDRPLRVRGRSPQPDRVAIRDHRHVTNSDRRMIAATGMPASYFFFMGVGTAGRSCRAVKADCAPVGFGVSCFGFFCSRLLRF